MSFSVGGLASGLDTSSIIQQLVGLERRPLQLIQQQRVQLGATTAAWGSLRSALSALQSTSQGLTDPRQGLSPVTATSSDETVAAVTVAPGTPPTSLSVTVTSLATAQTLATDAFAGSASTAIGTAGTYHVLGADSPDADTGVTSISGGALTVTAASTGAALSTTGAPPLQLSGGGLFGGNGPDLTVTTADGTTTARLNRSYGSAQALVDDLNDKLGAAGVRASLDDAGALVLTTVDEGSAATLSVSGRGATDLGLPAGEVAGTDATVRANGVTTTLAPGSTGVDVGGVQVTAGARLREGVVVGTTAETTYGELAASLSASGSPVRASVVDVDGTGEQARLVLTATSTGSAGRVRLVANPDGLPPLKEVRAGEDARLDVDGVEVTRGSNTVSDLVGGLTLQLRSTGTTEVTVADDDSTLTGDVGTLITQLNKVLTSTGDAESALRGTNARTLDRTLTSGIGSLVVGSTTAGGLGLELQRDGTYVLDEAALTAALARDRDGVRDFLAALATRLEEATTTALGEQGLVSRGEDLVERRDDLLAERAERLERRLELVETRLTKQFTALETALSSARAQGDWLAGALGNLLPGDALSR